MTPQTKQKLAELQNLEQNINTLIAQKQQYQAQEIEVDNALNQLQDTPKVFRIIGNIMVASSKQKVQKELDEKKEVVQLRLQAIDKQESKLRDKAKQLQQQVMQEMETNE